MNRECLWRKTQIEKKRKGFIKNVKKAKIISEITRSKEIPHTFSGTLCSISVLYWAMDRNGLSAWKHEKFFWTSYWRKSQQANELLYHSRRLKTSLWHYASFLNKRKVNNNDTTFKKLVALENTIALLKGTVMQIEKDTDKWSLTCFKGVLKISHSNYL